MNLFRGFLSLVALSFLFVSCQKEMSQEAGSNLSGKTEWEFKDSTIQFSGTMDTAYYDVVGPVTALTIEGTSADGLGSIFFQLYSTGSLEKGTYSNPNVGFNYSVGGTTLYENELLDLNKFSVTLTRVDSLIVEGTFSGEVFDPTGHKRIIRDGKFKAAFKGNSNIPPPPSGSGQLMLWAKSGCNGGPITVRVQGQQKNITSFHTAEPGCGATGTALFVLPQGQYTWEVVCGGDTTRGTAGIVAGSCIKAEVTLGAPTTSGNCVIRDYTAFDVLTNEFYYATKTIYNTANQATKIQFLESAGTVTKEFTFNYVTPGTFAIDAQQYFEIDPSSRRVKTFAGYIDPTDPLSSPKLYYNYTYDAAGHLARVTIALESNPTVDIIESVHTWSGGNLTKIVLRQIGAVERTEINYEYDVSIKPKNFLIFFANQELQMFQTVINTGVNSINAVSKSIVKEYGTTGELVSSEEAVYSAYTLDANKYVKDFKINGDLSVYGADLKYILDYKCF
ncbi:MAG TPA: hypothetical protein VM012_13910 [Flavitalea sp.]|nr:hypothetical protein [Flavitalea sp.]